MRFLASDFDQFDNGVTSYLVIFVGQFDIGRSFVLKRLFLEDFDDFFDLR